MSHLLQFPVDLPTHLAIRALGDHQWPILIRESTQRQVQEEFETEFINSVVVKGKTEPVKTYKVTGRKGAEPIKSRK